MNYIRQKQQDFIGKFNLPDSMSLNCDTGARRGYGKHRVFLIPLKYFHATAH